jgi:hypothetical protein
VNSTESGVQPPFAEDPIPEKGISLSKAFLRVLDALATNPTIVAPTLEEYAFDWKEDLEKFEGPGKEEAAANAFFRSHLIWGETIFGENLYALVRDPNSGAILQLNPRGWMPDAPFDSRTPFHQPRPAYEPISDGLDFDYVPDPYDAHFSGPHGTLIDGAYRPVFFWRDDFDRWFAKVFGAREGGRRGRRPGSGSYERRDEPLLKEMRKLIEDGNAKSPHEAACKVAGSAKGAGTVESRVTRLAKRYGKMYPLERN